MSSTPSRRDEATGPPAPEPSLPDGRYAHLPLDDGSVVIYDREEADTWLQSDYVVDLGA